MQVVRTNPCFFDTQTKCRLPPWEAGIVNPELMLALGKVRRAGMCLLRSAFAARKDIFAIHIQRQDGARLDGCKNIVAGLGYIHFTFINKVELSHAVGHFLGQSR